MALRLIEVVSIQAFFCCKIPERLFDIPQLSPVFCLDVELNVVERLVALRLVVNVDALNVVFHLSLEEVFDGSVAGSALHLLLQTVTEDPVQLLGIVLSEGIGRVPAEGPHQFFTVHSLVGRLQLVENILEGMDQRRRSSLRLVCCLLFVPIFVAGDAIYNLPELANVEKTLQQTIHVACCTMVLQTDVACLLFGVVIVACVDVVRLSDVALCTEIQGIVVIASQPTRLWRQLGHSNHVVPTSVNPFLAE
mmetsp:Transcript_15423/g.33400  ORF Transcript_15423/g.33400 Transcript_15423/m.33400 type:complete len:250 (-) Transcript_15423:783-1532(-)